MKDRQFEGFSLPSGRLPQDPGRSYDDPTPVKAFVPDEAADFSDYDLVTGGTAPTAPAPTDFALWTEAEIRAFLDQRGEDYDDCCDFQALIQRARECEAATGPATRPGTGTAAPQPDDDEVDPLDAFMAEIASIEKTTDADASTGQKSNSNVKRHRPAAERMEGDDHVAEFLERKKARQTKASTRNLNFGSTGADAVDSDEEVYAAERAADAAAGLGAEERGRGGDIAPLAPADHKNVEYEPFNKEFYSPPPELAALSAGDVAARRRALGVRVAGWGAPAPVETFSQLGFDTALAAAIVKAGYTAPTAIQAQALPAALSGRDVLGVAKTGSGKTAAFVLPMIVHIMDQRELDSGEGPIALIAAPTRELAEQIHREARRFGRPYNLSICAAFGGLPKHQQIKELKAGAEVAVATPGRMIDLIRAKACTLQRCTYVVLDEADRMFDLGFEPQVRSLLGQVRPDRQTLLFSATMPRRVERLAAEALSSPVRVTVGAVGAANEDVTQSVHIVTDDVSKRTWLLETLPGLVDEGEVIVFVSQKARAEELAAAISDAGVARAAPLHGDMAQAERSAALAAFKTGQTHVLVATDVAARGLDIKTIKTVVNFDAAKDIDTHVHRVGRTGRAGDKEGVAITLLTPGETRAAAELEQCLAAAGQDVPAALHEMAMRDPRARRRGGGRGGRGAGRGRGRGRGRGGAAVGGSGLGFAPEQQWGGVGGAGGHVPGFAPSHAGQDAHFDQTRPAAAPLPPLPAAAPLPPPSVPPGGWGALPPPPVVHTTSAPLPPPLAPPPLPPPPQQQQPVGPAAEWGAARQAAAADHLRGSFVSSGMRQGDVDARPEILMPRCAPGTTASGQPLPPPPVPVTQRPVYAAQHAQHAQQPTAAQSEEVQRAIAKAREIAARLTAQHAPSGGGGSSSGGGGGNQQWRWGSG